MQMMFLHGQYKTNNGYALFDEIAAGTKLSDVAYVLSAWDPKIGNVTLSRTDAATYSLSAEERINPAKMSWILEDGTAVSTNGTTDVVEGETANWTISGLEPDTTYRVSVVADNEGKTDVKEAGIIYTGELTVGATTDANEATGAAGTVAVSRASNDPFPLTLNYTTAALRSAAATARASSSRRLRPARSNFRSSARRPRASSASCASTVSPMVSASRTGRWS